MVTFGLCHLQDSLGRVEACPGARCAFWEEGGAVLEAGCAIERLELDLSRRPELAGSLLELREQLDPARSTDAGEGWRLLHRLAKPAPAR